MKGPILDNEAGACSRGLTCVTEMTSAAASGAGQSPPNPRSATTTNFVAAGGHGWSADKVARVHPGGTSNCTPRLMAEDDLLGPSVISLVVTDATAATSRNMTTHVR